MTIYTRAGDGGTTALFGGKRIFKSDLQVETYGSIDELSSILGIILSLSDKKTNDSLISSIQKDLYLIMSFLADGKVELSVLNNKVGTFEDQIDKISLGLSKLNGFILPQGNLATTTCHFARTVCRRSERTVVLYAKNSSLLKNPNILLIIRYLNRLSDLLFTLARQSSHKHEVVV